jgi:predicted Zn finger-like uncharacterized protein
MSLITRCPTCETLFKVVPDQLRISEGWVRCGQCNGIFDASLHLLPPSVGDIPLVLQDESSEVADSIDLLPEAFEINPEGEVLLQESAEQEPVDEDVKQDFSALLQEDALLIAGAVPEIFNEPEADENSGEEKAKDCDELNEVSFLRGRIDSTFWHRPVARVGLLILSLLLLLGLVGQVVFHERDRIVTTETSLKPLLLAICAPLKCSLSPLRQIEAIVIESSSFTKIRGDSYRLNLSLKNTAPLALAVPAVELTLTDALDLPVVRHVFLASDMGFKSETLPGGAEWPASLALTVKTSSFPGRVAGYRLLAFYP